MILADSNVLLDVIDDSAAWFDWSSARLDEAARVGLSINIIIYAEIAPSFARMADLDDFVSRARLSFADVTREMLFAAGAAHSRYRGRGGKRDRVLPDFIIGAQAAATGWALLTRDPRRYRAYFPDVQLITP